MAVLEIVALDEANNRLRVPGSGDSYLLPRNMDANGKNITNIATLSATNITGSIEYTPGAGGTTATNVQDAIDQVATNQLSSATSLYFHALSTYAHNASGIVFHPGESTLTAARVDAAIKELDAKIEALSVGAGMEEAPEDGNLYGRIDGEWVEIVGDGSYSVFSVGAAGLVPDPLTESGKVLFDTGWADFPMPVIYDVFDSTNDGLAPTTSGVAAPTTKFLRADGVWAVPA